MNAYLNYYPLHTRYLLTTASTPCTLYFQYTVKANEDIIETKETYYFNKG